MFYHLKIILRNMRRDKFYSAINIGGLAVGITACILVMLWVQDELSFDRFHKRSKDIYQTNVRFKITDNDIYWNIASAPLAFTAKEEIPEIENTCRYYAGWGSPMLKYKGEDKEQIFTGGSSGMVDSTFFSIFDFQVLEGDRQRMLVDPNSIVLSASVARQLFGDESPIGKALSDNNRQQYYVTGVMADMPKNSSVHFDFLLPFSLYEKSYPNELKPWGRFDFKTWFLLRPHTDVAAVEKKLTEIQNQHAQNIEVSYSLQSIATVNFVNADGSTNTKAQACRLFLIVAFVVILVACVNYVNISTARASRRNKEVFVRNIFGARKMKLFLLFFKESALIFLFSLVIAIYLLVLIFPAFNHLAGKQLEFHPFSIQTLIVYGLTFLIVVLFAGIYPAVNLAVKKPLHGVRNKSGNPALRRVLVVGQFAVAVVLIVITIGANKQLEHIRKKDLGYEKENVFYMPMAGNFRNHYDAVRSELQHNPVIAGVTATSMPLKRVTSTFGISFEESNINDEMIILLSTDKDFVPTMNIQLAAGRNFTGTPADAASAILNETAVKKMNITDPIGKTCDVRDGKRTIIGIVNDFHFKDLHTPVEPLVIISDDGWRVYMYVKASANNAPQAIAAVEKLWKQYESELPFSYYFIDNEFDTIYKTDLRTGILFLCFAIIAIFVSCLVLLGLITYIAEIKTKEIGIRKVFGASVSNIVTMLSKEFLILIGIAIFIAFPLAYYWLDRMLQDYAYHITISWRIFALAGIITVALTLLTVGWRAFKAATANPVNAIKSE